MEPYASPIFLLTDNDYNARGAVVVDNGRWIGHDTTGARLFDRKDWRGAEAAAKKLSFRFVTSSYYGVEVGRQTDPAPEVMPHAGMFTTTAASGRPPRVTVHAAPCVEAKNGYISKIRTSVGRAVLQAQRAGDRSFERLDLCDTCLPGWSEPDGYQALDRIVRVDLPKLLDSAGVDAEAAALHTQTPIVDLDTLALVMEPLRAAQRAAYHASGVVRSTDVDQAADAAIRDLWGAVQNATSAIAPIPMHPAYDKASAVYSYVHGTARFAAHAALRRAEPAAPVFSDAVHMIAELIEDEHLHRVAAGEQTVGDPDSWGDLLDKLLTL